MANTIGKEVIRFNQAVQDEWIQVQNRRRELQAHLAQVKAEQKQISVNLGAWVAEGCDYQEYTSRLAELRAESEAIHLGIDYLNGQAGLLKRQNSWLSTAR